MNAVKCQRGKDSCMIYWARPFQLAWNIARETNKKTTMTTTIVHTLNVLLEFPRQDSMEPCSVLCKTKRGRDPLTASLASGHTGRDRQGYQVVSA